MYVFVDTMRVLCLFLFHFTFLTFIFVELL